MAQHKSPQPNSTSPPGSWTPAHRRVQRLLAPVERFLHIEAASGIVLMIAAMAALVWANSPWRESYEHIWHIPLGFTFGDFAFQRDLHFWITDGLMTIFFFVVGLEIRREMHGGELSELRRAALPLAAALGGMFVPAAIFFAFNYGRPSAVGWAVPMATDIAFAVGVLALLGKRAPPALRILLLALAVIDDIGAILVIAFFYSGGLAAVGFALLVGGMLGVAGLQVVGVRPPLAYSLPGVLVWAGAYAAGIHPTLAGVILGFMTPVKAWYGARTFLDHTEAEVRALRTESEQLDERDLLPRLNSVQKASREAVSPVERLQYLLHGWVAFGIMPLFAFANAGVSVGSISLEGDALWVFAGVTLGLAAGKPLGILGMSWLTAKMKLAALPTGVRWSQVSIVGLAGGIGFTMSLFVAQLAFPPGPLLETTKLAILCGSGLAGLLAVASGYWTLKPEAVADAARTEAEAEASTTQ